MAIKKQYQAFCEQQTHVLNNIQKFSVLASFLYIVVIINYLMFIRTRIPADPTQPHSYFIHYRPSFFVVLCDLYTLGISILNTLIFKWQKKRKQDLQQIMGSVVDYDRYYLEFFKIANFGILVAGIVRVFEEGLYQWIYGLGLIIYCVLQLVLADAMTNLELKILKAETTLQENKEENFGSESS